MSSYSFIASYKVCDKCGEGMSRSGDNLCKDCKPKKIYNRTLGKSLSKKHLHRFETKSISSNRRNIIENKFPALALYSSNFKIVKEVSLIKSTKTPLLYFKIYWDQFVDFDSFSSFIVNSNQIGTSYFAFDSFKIQQKPKIQLFIQSKIDKLPIILPSIENTLSVPLSSPLKLLRQRSYWDSLIVSYFQNVHTAIPLFSIHSFDLRTVSKPLLSAIYYGGFLFMQDKPREILNYFNGYIKKDINEAIRSISIQNTISVLLYSFLQLISGNFSLSKVYQTHAIRMSYSLGLHLKLSKLSPTQEYDRIKLFSTLAMVHIGTNGIGSLSLNQLTETGELNIEYSKPQYQTPTSNCAFYFDTEDENIVYGLCTDMHSRFNYIQSLSLWHVSKCSEDLVQKEFDKYYKKINFQYLKNLQNFNILSLKFPHLKPKIQKCSFQLLLDFSNVKLELYRILKSKVIQLKSSQIANMLGECCILFDLVLESKDLKQVYHIYPYTVGLTFIKVYPISNLKQQKLIKNKLTQLIVFLSSRACTDKLSYLVIKNEFEKIMKL